MKREIKFRGKNHQGRWYFGSLIVDGEFTIIKRKVLAFGPDNRDGVPIKNDYYWESYHVDPETVGQFTGVLDGRNQEIYENDIVATYFDGHCTYQGEVRFEAGRFIVSTNNGLLTNIGGKSWLVIGNIHDNPELMEGGEE